MSRFGLLPIVVALVLGVSACSSSGGSDTTSEAAGTPTTEAATSAPETTTTMAGGEPATTVPETTTTTTSAAEPAIPAPVPYLPVGTLITTLTPESGVGHRPDLVWEPVEGAVTYQVIVYDTEVRPYWAWEGQETTVVFGGEPRLRDGAAGPAIVPGMYWAVSAHDADGIAVAASAMTPIAP